MSQCFKEAPHRKGSDHLAPPSPKRRGTGGMMSPDSPRSPRSPVSPLSPKSVNSSWSRKSANVSSSVENIKVSVRVRPFSKREITLGCTCVIAMEGPGTTVLSSPPRAFVFDQSYWSHDSSSPHFASQETIMQDIGTTLIQSSMDGFNSCVFAYGQTGSGKSFSVLGSQSVPGLVPWTMEKIFHKKAEIEAEGNREMQLEVHYLEIYNDDLRDLLHVKMKGESQLRLVDHPTIGVYVPGLEGVPCDSLEKVEKLMAFGQKARVVAATSMHDHSSRSHAVFTVNVVLLEGKKPARGEPDNRRSFHGKINFVDLAGSERQSKTHTEGQHFKEGCAINKGLTALGLCIRTLAENSAGSHKQTMVPFRTSKLTFLLKDSLYGNSKTHMIAAISPASDNIDETIGTLRFASSVKEIKTNAVRNVQTAEMREGLAEALQGELDDMKQKLAENADENENLKEALNEREKQLESMQKSYEEKLEHAREADKAREQMLEGMMLRTDSLTSSFGVDKMTPYLLNMSDDPTLVGCLLFYIVPGEQRTIGSDDDNSIPIQGIGITDKLCVVENKNNVYLTIAKTGKEGRVVVSGKPLEEGKPMQLRHGMRVYFGRAIAMKVCMPATLQAGGNDDQSDLLLDSIEDESNTIEHSITWNNMQDFVRHMIGQMPPEHASAFMEEVKLAVKVCDEANEITAECRKQDGLSFEADITGAMRPSVVVRVLKTWGSEAEGTDQCQQLYIWSTSQMLERLDRMKEYYHTFCTKGTLEMDGLQDPWHEAHITDIWHTLTDVEVRLQDALDQNALLKSGQISSLSKALVAWQSDRSEAVIRAAFSAWKEDVLYKKSHRRPASKMSICSAMGSLEGAGSQPSGLKAEVAQDAVTISIPQGPTPGSTLSRDVRAESTVTLDPRGDTNGTSHYDSLLDRFEMLLDRLAPAFGQENNNQRQPAPPATVTSVRRVARTIPAAPVQRAAHPYARVYPLVTNAQGAPAPRLLTPQVFATTLQPQAVQPVVLATSTTALMSGWPSVRRVLATRELSPEPPVRPITSSRSVSLQLGQVTSVTRATSPPLQVRTLSRGQSPSMTASSPRLTSVAISPTGVEVPRLTSIAAGGGGSMGLSQGGAPLSERRIARKSATSPRGGSPSWPFAVPAGEQPVSLSSLSRSAFSNTAIPGARSPPPSAARIGAAPSLLATIG